jgi:hypothetical protein
MTRALVVAVIEVVLDAREVVAGAVAVAYDCFPPPLEHAVTQTMNAPRKAHRVSDRLVTKIESVVRMRRLLRRQSESRRSQR